MAHTDLIKELDRLWEPVYPYLAQEIQEYYGRHDGTILEIGPFCGVIFDLLKQGIGSSYLIASFPEGMGDFFRQRSKEQNLGDRVKVIETDPSLACIEESKIDLAIFRGAFFFPTLFQVNSSAIDRVLSPKGLAFIGGGFGKLTPDSIIKEIGKRLRDLNYQIGKKEVSEADLREETENTHFRAKVQIISEGGLWVLLRRDPVPA